MTALPVPRPQLATLVDAAPDGDDWLHEIKYDGYRLLGVLEGGRVRLITRNEKDWTDRYPGVAAELEQLPADSAIVDGEVVVVLGDGRTSFQALQNVQAGVGDGVLRFMAFDLLHLDGRDVSREPLEERKALLETVLGALPGELVHYSDHVDGQGVAFHAQACRLGLEGIISKRRDAPYRRGRTREWVKVKCLREQEFAVVGYTAPQGARTGFGALWLAAHDGSGELLQVGKVGTGFDDATLRALHARLRKLEVDEPPVANPPRGAAARGTRWVRPELVAQVAFTEMTADRSLRHPVYRGLREDKAAADVVFESPAPSPSSGGDMTNGGKAGSGKASTSGSAVKAHRSAAASGSATPTSAKQRSSGSTAPTRQKARSCGSAASTSRKPASPGSTSKPGETSKSTTRQPASRNAATPRTRGRIDVAGVSLSNPDRVLYEEQQVTKLDLAHYYEAIADWILPHISDRPLTLVRCPSGRGDCFYQKHIAESMPSSILRVEIPGDPQPYGAIRNLQGLIALVQFGVLELHTWGARRDRVEQPDRIVLDLDPDPSIPWERVRDAAGEVREAFRLLELESFVRTTGGKGLHVVVPFRRGPDWDEVKAFSRAVAEAVSGASPGRYTLNIAKAKRRDRILIDYLRNGRGATAIESYSTRARRNAPVAVPLSWDELGAKDVREDYFNIHTVPDRLASLERDPWQEYAAVKQSVTVAVRKKVKRL